MPSGSRRQEIRDTFGKIVAGLQRDDRRIRHPLQEFAEPLAPQRSRRYAQPDRVLVGGLDIVIIGDDIVVLEDVCLGLADEADTAAAMVQVPGDNLSDGACMALGPAKARGECPERGRLTGDLDAQ